jgi:hypothetical protein
MYLRTLHNAEEQTTSHHNVIESNLYHSKFLKILASAICKQTNACPK